MPRVKSGKTNKARHKKVLKRAKGFYSANSRAFIHATEKVDRAMAYMFKGRKLRKRQFRALWNQRINAAARLNGTTYSRLIGGLIKAGVDVNRKSLSELAIHDPAAFTKMCSYAIK
ncbi:MAG: 50S ribosomal protein L20 [Bdellovibrionales bacterium]|nr:50S ribosomal protein L20 [Bdellovibrionales bacterium]